MSNNYVHFMNKNMVSVTNLGTGSITQFFSSDPKFEEACEHLRAKRYEEFERLNEAIIVQSYLDSMDDQPDEDVSISISGGNGTITVFGHKYTLPDVLVDKIIALSEGGFDTTPLKNFIKKLYQNPSSTAVNELYLFLDKAQLPITEDGDFIAYKIVTHDYKDCYTRKMDNSIGKTISMPRNEVDDNRNNKCSRGLHFCSRDYLPHYGTSGDRDRDRCVLVKINPADVVSIPSDYDNTKGRTWRYTVVGEVEGDWRSDLKHRDYTDQAVVKVENASQESTDEDRFQSLIDRLESNGIEWMNNGFWNLGECWWYSLAEVNAETGISIDDLRWILKEGEKYV